MTCRAAESAMHAELPTRGAGRYSNHRPATTLVVAAIRVTERSRSLLPFRRAFHDACMAADVKTNPTTIGLTTAPATLEPPFSPVLLIDADSRLATLSTNTA